MLNGIKFTKFFYCLSNCHGLCTWNTPFVYNGKYAVFRVITELTKNLVRVRKTIIDTLLSEQFSAHFSVCCVVTRSILKPTGAITTENQKKLY